MMDASAEKLAPGKPSHSHRLTDLTKSILKVIYSFTVSLESKLFRQAAYQ